MVRSAWARHAGATVATAAALVYGLQSGCFYPDYTFNEPEPSGVGGATTTGAPTGTSSAGGAPSTSSATSSGVGG